MARDRLKTLSRADVKMSMIENGAAKYSRAFLTRAVRQLGLVIAIATASAQPPVYDIVIRGGRRKSPQTATTF